MAATESNHFASKTAGLLGIVRVLSRDADALSKVRAAVSAETRDFIDRPPPVSVWVPGPLMVELQENILAVLGAEGLRKVVRDSVRETSAPLMRSMIEGALRLFGASPASLFSLIGAVSEKNSRGVTLQYVALSPRSGRIEYRITALPRMPEALALGLLGVLDAIYDLCSTTGTVQGPSYPAPNHARFEVQW